MQLLGLFKTPNNELEKGGRSPARQDADTTVQTKLCPACGRRLPVGDLWNNHSVCPCGHHFRMNARQRVSFITDPDSFALACFEFPEKIVAGIDAKDGLVRTAGWEENSGLEAVAFARQMEKLGVRYIIFTDIDTDGTLSGPAYPSLERLQGAVGCCITASGGVSRNEDLRRLKEMGLYGAIIGKAWYAGKIDLKLAVEEAGRQ